MRVIVPFTRLEPLARSALEPFRPVYIDVSSDDLAYWRLLRGLWLGGKPFVIVEHDVIVWPDTIPELERCPEPWCAQAIHSVDTGAGRNWSATLGCVRFRPWSRSWSVHPTPWQRLDSAVGDALRAQRGKGVHVHFPILLHLNASVIDYARHVTWLAGT